MKINEEKKNKRLAYKFSSHTVNLLSLPLGTEEFRKERRKAHRAKHRFFNYVQKTIEEKKKNR